MTTMYRLSPIIDSSKMVYDLPDRMYSLPVILKSMDEPTDNLEVTKVRFYAEFYHFENVF